MHCGKSYPRLHTKKLPAAVLNFSLRENQFDVDAEGPWGGAHNKETGLPIDNFPAGIV